MHRLTQRVNDRSEIVELPLDRVCGGVAATATTSPVDRAEGELLLKRSRSCSGA